MKQWILLSVFLFSLQAYGKDLISGYAHTCEIKNNKLNCWGWNYHGQIGDGTTDTKPGIYTVSLPAGPIRDIAAGNGHTCAIVDKDLYCWGQNHFNQVRPSLSKNENVVKPSRVELPGIPTQVTASAHTTCAVVDGGVMCWGMNYSCQVGQKRCKDNQKGDYFSYRKPQWVDSLEAGSNVTDIDGGDAHFCVVVKKGVKCWGSGLFGRLGDHKMGHVRGRPLWVKGYGAYAGVRNVAASDLHTCFTIGKVVRCWGRNRFIANPDGHGDHVTFSPRVVPLYAGRIKMLSVTDGHTCASNGRSIQCWGTGYYGQLGNGKDMDADSPVRVKNLKNIQAISTGAAHSCARTNKGTFCWGWNTFCNLGLGQCEMKNTNQYSTPQKIMD